MNDQKNIEDIIELLDGKCESGVSRIKVTVTEDRVPGGISEQYHRGRCDVGSPWATGSVRNFDCIDYDPE